MEVVELVELVEVEEEGWQRCCTPWSYLGILQRFYSNSNLILWLVQTMIFNQLDEILCIYFYPILATGGGDIWVAFYPLTPHHSALTSRDVDDVVWLGHHIRRARSPPRAQLLPGGPA